MKFRRQSCIPSHPACSPILRCERNAGLRVAAFYSTETRLKSEMQRAGQELISFFVAFRLRIARLEQATKLYPGKNQGGGYLNFSETKT